MKGFLFTLLGACVSLLGSVFISDIDSDIEAKIRNLLCYLTFVILVLVFWDKIISSYYTVIQYGRTKGLKFSPKIGVLSDLSWDEGKDVVGWSNISPEKWKRSIMNKFPWRYRVKLIKSTRDLRSFISIINPYGGIYFEDDLETKKSLRKIFQYVNYGGYFINVADVPGYWAYDPKIGRKTLAAPTQYLLNQKTNEHEAKVSFNQVPFIKKLGLEIHETEKSVLYQWEPKSNIMPNINNISKISVQRAINCKENVNPIIESKNVGETKLSPFVEINYGKGKFVISTISLSEADKKFENGKMRDVIIDYLANEFI